MNTSHIAIAVALTAFCGPALAGGLAPSTPEPQPIIEVNSGPTGFEGAYIGASLGYNFPGDDKVGVKGPGISGTDNIGDLDMGGGSFAVQAGYRWDLNPAIIGVELGATFGNISADFDNSEGEGENTVDYAVSLRGSLGWEATTDTLLYGFAGASHGQFDYSVERAAGGDISEEYGRTGYLGGFGVERNISDNWSLRGEYQYTNYGNEKLSNGGYSTEATPDYHSVTLGLNYSFGG
ncbi:outer membrane protein [Aliiruegeria lutimaris]|uniref:Outer membrane immunogenic protein n=1 Tax=Aliiruegeria lutimaris TaxID=571298 RepID=A0A1G8TRD7_9RHOB|nr:outer membrane beta-barrel protein [Aliiruegeria lutimaris]SDJ44091.1 outer membrane immunogenic protein [Aliiruegeria lutimaris]